MYTMHAPETQPEVSSVSARLARLEAARRHDADHDDADADFEDALADEPEAEEARRPEGFSAWHAVGWLWSGRLIILVCLILGVVGAFVVSRGLPPRFTSYADIVIAPPTVPVTPDSFTAPAPQRDTQLLEFNSRLRMLTSTNVIQRTVEALALDEDPEFVGQTGFSLPFFGPSAEERQTASLLAATRSLYGQVGAFRDAQTYVATLYVHSQDPQKSVRIANALIESFQQELWETERDASAQAVTALEQRLGDLRQRVADAEAAVETFRAENGLQGGTGQLLSSLSLGQVNTQINDARAALIAAESRHAELVGARSSALGQDGVWDNEAVASLRAEYHELRRELDARLAVYGARHPNITALQPQIGSLETAINQEVDRLIRAAASDVEQARSVVDRLMAQSEETRGRVSTDESALIRLRELQREAETQGAIYESYLRRLGELSEQSQVEITTVRVISPPLPAESRSWPPRAVILMGIGLALGLMLGGLIALTIGAARFYLPGLREKLGALPARA